MNAGVVTLIVIVILISLLLLIKLYLKLSIGWDRSPTCLVGKTAIVTGANSGIGYYTALDFAKRGARVVLACRDPARAEEAKTKIIEATGNQNVLVRILDLASLASIRKFAVETKATEERLDILVNNAGLGGLDHSITADGLSLCMQINYFGPFLLTILLIGLLKRSAPSRIVNVSSIAAKTAKLNVNDLNALPSGCFPKIREYSNTKLCNILFTNELARKLKGSGVDTNSLHPGVVQSELYRNVSSFLQPISACMSKFFYKTAEEGAQTSIYLAVSKDVSGISGEYFSDCKIASMPSAARNRELSKKVWDKSEEFVKLTQDEKLV